MPEKNPARPKRTDQKQLLVGIKYVQIAIYFIAIDATEFLRKNP
jgi:hypothetical protein